MPLFLLLITVLASGSCVSMKEKRMATGSGQTTEVLPTIAPQELGFAENTVALVKSDIDLKGRSCELPKGVTLKAEGGKIKNGTLVGNGTKIEGSTALFDKVTIRGTWAVPHISTRLFADLSYTNSLRDVVALANPSIKNTITIEPGNYAVYADKRQNDCICISDRTALIVNGTIQLLPNDHTDYNIIRATGTDIKITGTGQIIGDKHKHLGTAGEWGMGINFMNAHNASVTGLTISECWGDCIYVGRESTRIEIANCTLIHGRRQGISVTWADNVSIHDCTIRDVGGTAPEYAIDIEPNNGTTVDNVSIENVTVEDCVGGFLVTRNKGHKSSIGKVEIRNCRVSTTGKIPINIELCKSAKVRGCAVDAYTTDKAISCRNAGSITIENNTMTGRPGIAASKAIEVSNCQQKAVKKNIVRR